MPFEELEQATRDATTQAWDRVVKDQKENKTIFAFLQHPRNDRYLSQAAVQENLTRSSQIALQACGTFVKNGRPCFVHVEDDEGENTVTLPKAGALLGREFDCFAR